ncbi:hypothetical protein [Agarivorans gilvus]|jgi:type VI protein secretion system component VasK|uniref:Uncharacterized protein n=1 Tax=Agarivorans gilvus TaxID=680279 RepID=A0ABQ1I4R2_9ALTE|nr:hypothetical protein [Agarivorans gilvus]GGB11234.1 hypothetical protein GCM10007414_25850 [Agarivorans gilvus]
MLWGALLSLLLSLWRFSIIYSSILIVWLYCHFRDLDFEQVDSGVNQHKVIIIAIYFGYLAFWWLVNPYLSKARRQPYR